MRKRLWGGRTSRTTSTLLLSAVTVAFIVIAATAQGFPVRHVSANDGVVWLTNNSDGSYGQFNDPISELSTLFSPPGAFQSSYDLDVLQDGSTVLAEDRGRGDLYSINPQAGSVDTKGVTVPGGAGSEVSLGGTVAAVLDPATGQLWAAVVGSGSRASLAGLVTTGKPLLHLGGAAALAVGDDGTTYVAAPGELVTFPLVRGAIGPPKVQRFAHQLSTKLALAVAGDTPAILDERSRSVFVPSSGATVPLPVADTTPDLVVQQPGPAAGAVVVASDSTTYSIPLKGGAPTVLLSGGNGQPAQPVRLGACVHAAWKGGPGRYGELCDGQAPAYTALPGPPLVSPVFRVNHGEIVINDVANGDAWSVKDPTVQALDSGDWSMLLQSIQPNVNPNSPQTGHDKSLPQNQPPKANDVNLSARAGHSSILHVLDTDSDPSGSVLTIVHVAPASGQGWQAQIAPDGQTVGLQMDSTVNTPIHFQYTITNTGGQTATGTVTVTPTTAETPPVLRSGYTATTDHLASGSVGSFQVLGDWRDGESDPLAVTTASAAQGTVTWTGDGLLTYTAPVVAQDTPITVTYQVSDGLDAPTAGQVQVIVLGQGDTTMYPAVAKPDAYQVVVGKPAAVQPLQNDVGGADPLHPQAQLALAGPITAPTGLAVSTNTATGLVTITAQQPGVYGLSYQDSFGSAPVAAGQMLVDARAAATGPQSPVAVPESVLLHGQLPSTVNVAGADYDPDGGVLTVVEVSAPSSIQATVVGGAYLRLASAASSLSGQQVVNYQITNGTTQPVAGQVTVTWAPPLPSTPPVAPAVTAVVRAGDEVDVPVLSKDSDPAGQPMHLLPGTVTVTPAGVGAASVSAGVLRYAAPSPATVPSARPVTATYVVEDSAGERTTGTVNLTVNPVDAATDHAPQPGVVVARVTAGGATTIPIPTSGVDPDGDSVALTGLVDPPQMGRILSMTSSSITYQAYPSSGGTDDLTYQVTDPFGQTGQASLRIAVAPVGQAQAPVAVADNVTAAPGAAVIVPILANDLIAHGDQVQIEPLTATNAWLPAGTKLVGDDLEVVAPSGATPVVVTYGITDGIAAPSLAQVTVRSQPSYVVPPIAVDDYPKAPTANQAAYDVHVLANDSDPSGSPDDLKVVAVFAADAHISGDDVVVDVQPNPQVVAYEIRNPAGGTAIGDIHLPSGAPGPVLKAGTISVPRNGSTTVDVSRYVTDVHGPVHLVSTADVFTAPANGLSWAPQSATSVTLSGIAGYIGPGSLTVEVSDARSPTDKDAKSALLSIPVQVGPAVPVITCPSTPLTLIEGGAAVNIRLSSVCQVYTPDPTVAPTLAFSATWGTHPAGVDLSLGGANHQILTLAAESSATAGTSGSVMVSVAGATGAAKLPVTVMAAPPPTVGSVSIPGVLTGHTATVDFRQYVSSPFPKPSVSVVSVQQTGAGSAQLSHSGSTVSISPQTGTHGTMTFTALVTDIASRPDRAVATTISLQVLDVPGNPGALQGVTGDQQVALSWSASAANGSPVAYYTVTQGGSSHQVAGTSYTWTGLTNGTNYSFSVTAHNQVGNSPGASTASFSPQAKPGAPGTVTATPGDGQVMVAWQPAVDNGQPIDSYLITVTPASGGSLQTVAGTATSYTWTGLSNNVGPYTFTVTAHNALGVGPSASSSAVYAHGVPSTPPAPTASGIVGTDQTSTAVTVSFPAVSQCNDAQPCKSYTVTQLKGGDPDGTQTVTTGCSSGSGECATFGPLTTDGSQYTYTVAATNTEGQTSEASPASQPSVNATGKPGTVSDLSATKEYEALQVTFTVPPSHGAGLTEIKYSATTSGGGASPSGSWTDQLNSGSTATETISGLTYNDSYSVSVSACNNTTCGGNSNTASATPYGPPAPPSVSAQANGNSITFYWSGGGGSGQPISNYTVCVDGGCSSKGSSAGSENLGFNCAETHSVYAYVTDATNRQSSNSSTASATTAACPPPPTTTTAPSTYSETETSRHPVNAFSDYHNAGGESSTQVAAGQTVQVTCKVLDGNIPSSNPDGYWYKLASQPWNNAYYATANTFENGGNDTTDIINTDPNVRNC